MNACDDDKFKFILWLFFLKNVCILKMQGMSYENDSSCAVAGGMMIQKMST